MVSGKDAEQKLERKLKFGMIGGGRDAFIGGVHRRAAISDGYTEFVAGAPLQHTGKGKTVGPGLAACAGAKLRHLARNAGKRERPAAGRAH